MQMQMQMPMQFNTDQRLSQPTSRASVDDANIDPNLLQHPSADTRATNAGGRRVASRHAGRSKPYPPQALSTLQSQQSQNGSPTGVQGNLQMQPPANLSQLIDYNNVLPPLQREQERTQSQRQSQRTQSHQHHSHQEPAPSRLPPIHMLGRSLSPVGPGIPGTGLNATPSSSSGTSSSTPSFGFERYASMNAPGFGHASPSSAALSGLNMGKKRGATEALSGPQRIRRKFVPPPTRPGIELVSGPGGFPTARRIPGAPEGSTWLSKLSGDDTSSPGKENDGGDSRGNHDTSA